MTQRRAPAPHREFTGTVIFPANAAPVPGLYRSRIVKNGPLVPVALCWGCPWVDPAGDVYPDDWCQPADRSPRLRWYVNGEEQAVPDQLFPLTGEPIASAEYLYLVGVAAWAKRYAPTEAVTHPKRRIDLDTTPPPF